MAAMSSNELLKIDLSFDAELGIDFMFVYQSAINHYRSMADFDDVYEKYKDKTVLVVTHGGVSIVCGYYFCGPPKKDRNEYFCKNCAVKEYIKE